jgi:hypothetical protein
VVRIADEPGPLPVGAFAARIAAARRDQQQLLSESEQRILEDALLTRLAQQPGAVPGPGWAGAERRG